MAASNPLGLSAADREHTERVIKERQSDHTYYMDWHRERWSGCLKKISASREKVSEFLGFGMVWLD